MIIKIYRQFFELTISKFRELSWEIMFLPLKILVSDNLGVQISFKSYSRTFKSKVLRGKIIENTGKIQVLFGDLANFNQMVTKQEEMKDKLKEAQIKFL